MKYQVTLSLDVALESIKDFSKRVETFEKDEETRHTFFYEEKSVVFEEYAEIIRKIIDEITKKFNVDKDNVIVDIPSESFWDNHCSIEFTFSVEEDKLKQFKRNDLNDYDDRVELCGKTLYLYAYEE